jgi:hypothetical protein
VFSGTNLGGAKATVLENCSHAADLGNSVSPREKGVFTAIEETEGHCYKPNKNLWLSQVSDKWDAFVF